MAISNSQIPPGEVGQDPAQRRPGDIGLGLEYRACGRLRHERLEYVEAVFREQYE
jgi:hypothetical protein